MEVHIAKMKEHCCILSGGHQVSISPSAKRSQGIGCEFDYFATQREWYMRASMATHDFSTVVSGSDLRRIEHGHSGVDAS